MMGKYPRISCNEFLAPSELIIFISKKNNSDLILQQVGSSGLVYDTCFEK